MVMQRYSEPSSPNPNDSDNFNDIAGNHETLSGWNNFPLNDISTEDDEGDVISTTSIPVGYALLGSETVHLAADDSGDDDDDDDSERNELSDTENGGTGNNIPISQQVTNIQSIGCDNTTVDADGGSFSLQIDVDHLLNRHLNRTEFEPRGVFTASNLCTNVSEDSSHIELWNQNTPASTSQFTITPDEADKIKMCMSNFHLPISRYPTWATQIPEELWKAKLLEKIEHNTKT
uniref:Male-enhanced antigen 1 n=1 Tax=Schistosoma japonicum TaxID=6182 RepID=B3GUV2_SCHJA